MRLTHKTTPVGFEPTRGDPIGLAGRRLSHSAKVSFDFEDLLLTRFEEKYIFLAGIQLLDRTIEQGISGLVVEYIVAIDVTRARFPADAYCAGI